MCVCVCVHTRTRTCMHVFMRTVLEEARAWDPLLMDRHLDMELSTSTRVFTLLTSEPFLLRARTATPTPQPGKKEWEADFLWKSLGYWDNSGAKVFALKAWRNELDSQTHIKQCIVHMLDELVIPVLGLSAESVPQAMLSGLTIAGKPASPNFQTSV